MIFRLRRYLVAALCSLGIFAAQFAGAQTPMVSGVSISSPVSGDTYELAEEIRVQVTFDRAVDVTGRPQLALTVGSTTRQAGYSGYVPGGTTYRFSYVVRSSDSDSDGVSVGASALTLNGGTIKIRGGTTDATLSLGTHAIANSVNHKVDGSRVTAPIVNNVVIERPASGDTFGLAETINVLVYFDRSVDVTGTPRIALTIGSATRQAVYSHVSGDFALVLRYAPRSSDSDSDGISIGASALTLNGGTIRIRGGTANATLGLGTHAIANSANHKVDGSQEATPTVNSVSIGSRPVVGDTYETAEDILIGVSFNRPVDVTGTPQLALTVGSTTRQANHYATWGTWNWFRYSVQSSDGDSDGISIGASALTLNGGTIRIRGGTTNGTLGLGTHAIANSANHKVDGSRQTAPTVTDVTIGNPARGDTFEFAETIAVRVTFDRMVAATGRLQLALTIGSTTRGVSAIHSFTFRSRQLSFYYSVRSSDRDVDGISIGANALTLDGGAIRHVGGATNAALSLGRHAIANSASHKVDGRREKAPTVRRVSIIPPVSGDTYGLGETIASFVRFDRRVDATDHPVLALTIGSALRQANLYVVGNSVLGFQYVVQSSDRDSDGISIGANALTLNEGAIRIEGGNADASLNLGSHAISNSVNHKVDGSMETTPAVNLFSLGSPVSDDTYEFGEVIFSNVRFDRAVEVLGEPQLALTIGSMTRQARFFVQRIAGAGTTVTFRYVVQTSDVDADGISVGANAMTLNGGTIRTRGGTASASLNLGSYAISNAANHKVDGSRETAPTVQFVTIVSSPAGGDYNLGAEIVVRVIFDRAVNVAGVPQLALTVGLSTREASYVEHLEEGYVARDPRSLYFRYVVQQSDHDPDGISIGANALSLNGGTITTQGSTTNAALGLGDAAISNAWVHKVNAREASNAPTQVRAEATAAGLLITWAAATGATSYKVQWRRAGQAWSSVRQEETTATRLEIGGLGAGSYEVRVVAVVDGQDGAASGATEGEVAAPANTAPGLAEELPDMELDVGETKTVHLATAFEDPDDDLLRYSASSDDGAVSVRVASGVARIHGVRPGEATVTVVATDPEGLSARATFKVEVGALLSLPGNTAAPEGGKIVLTATLSRALAEPLDVGWQVVPDGDPLTRDADASDYESAGTATIPAGQTASTFEIAILDDGDIEPAREYFVVALDEPQDANVGLSRRARASATIQEGVCDRTPAVRDELTRNWRGCHLPRPFGLAQVPALNLAERGIDSLHANDLLGLSGLLRLDLRGNELAALPPTLLAATPRLRTLDLSDNALEALPDGLFAGLGRLREVSMEGNPGAPFHLAVELVRTDAEPWAPGPATVSARATIGAPFAMATPLVVTPAAAESTVPPTVEIAAGDTTGTSFAAPSVAGASLAVHADAVPMPNTQCSGMPCFRGFETVPGSTLILFHRPPQALAAPTPQPLAGGDALHMPLESLIEAGDAPDDMDWEASSSDESLAKARIVGADLVVEPEPASEGRVEITLVATDSRGFATTVRFEVQVEFHWPQGPARGWRSILGNATPDAAASTR